MKLLKIKPYGFCAGVDKAIKIALKAKEENPCKNVYLLGMIVHNEEVVDILKNKGLLILNENNDSLENLILSIENNSVLVFSAHGHSSKLDEMAKTKDLLVYDATCPFVKENMFEAQKHKSIIYIGVKGHLESEAFLANNPHVTFFDLKTNTFENEKIVDDNTKIITQTTISILELNESLEIIKRKYPKAELIKERCGSTTLRQQEINNLKDTDYLIVLGSKTSNNSKKLAELGSNKGIITYLCNSLDDVEKLNLDTNKKVALASGASTSSETYNSVATYLEELN